MTVRNTEGLEEKDSRHLNGVSAYVPLEASWSENREFVLGDCLGLLLVHPHSFYTCFTGTLTGCPHAFPFVMLYSSDLFPTLCVKLSRL